MLMLLVLVLWWFVVVFVPRTSTPQPPPTTTLLRQTEPVAAADPNYVLPRRITIKHSSKQGVETYQGELALPNCDMFSTGVSTTGTRSVTLALVFRVTKAADGACTDAGTSTTPFLISYASPTTHSPSLAGITINDTPVSFSVIKGNAK